MELLTNVLMIFISAALINNFVLHYFVGICPFMGVSKRVDTAFGMGLAVIFVMVIASTLSWVFTTFILRPMAPIPVWVWNIAGGNPDTVVDLSVLLGKEVEAKRAPSPDEPFAGLDPVNAELLKGIIAKFRDQDKTVILSTHRMNEVEELCDRIFMINRGQSVLYGELAEIKSKYKNNSVILQYEGDLTRLKGITGKHDYKNHIELFFDATASPQMILEQLVSQGIKIDRFEVSTPSLHDIFLQLVEEAK